MSIRCSGLASRSFIIGSRLCPPAMIRASGPSRSSDAIAPSTLVARSYSNGAGVCNAVLLSRSGGLGRQALARRSDVLALLVLLGRAGADHRRDRAASPGSAWRTLGYSSRAARLPPSTLRSTAPFGLSAAIGASRPRRASVSVPFV